MLFSTGCMPGAGIAAHQKLVGSVAGFISLCSNNELWLTV